MHSSVYQLHLALHPGHSAYANCEKVWKKTRLISTILCKRKVKQRVLAALCTFIMQEGQVDTSWLDPMPRTIYNHSLETVVEHQHRKFSDNTRSSCDFIDRKPLTRTDSISMSPYTSSTWRGIKMGVFKISKSHFRNNIFSTFCFITEHKVYFASELLLARLFIQHSGREWSYVQQIRASEALWRQAF